MDFAYQGFFSEHNPHKNEGSLYLQHAVVYDSAYPLVLCVQSQDSNLLPLWFF